MSDEAVLLPKCSPNGTIILAKYQFGHSYSFWTMPILIFSPVYLVLRHPLYSSCTMHTFWSSVFDFFDVNRSSKLNASVVKVNFCFWVFFKKFPSVLNFMIDGNPKSWVRFLQTFVTTIWSLQYIFPLYRNLIIISRSSFNNEGQNISTLQHSVQVSMHASVQVIFCQKH